MTDSTITTIHKVQGFLQALVCSVSDRDIMDGKPGNLVREGTSLCTDLQMVAGKIECMERIIRSNEDEIYLLRKKIDGLSTAEEDPPEVVSGDG